jgi:deoxyguanosine kinase
MPERDDNDREETLPQRYPFIAVVGPVGIGKTTFTELVTDGADITKLQEPYQENPYLKDFYTKNPADYSFDCQMFFLANDGVQATKISGLSKSCPVIRDAGGEMNLMIATTQWKMDWMTDEEYETYVSSYNNVFKDKLNPDVYIALKAKESTVIERIKNRKREMELTMNEKYPEYFPTIVREFNIWLAAKQKESGNKIVVVDTDEFNFTHGNDKKEMAVTEVKNWLSYFISNPHQRNGVGSDGARLIMPSSFRTTPHFIDRVPGAKINY